MQARRLQVIGAGSGMRLQLRGDWDREPLVGLEQAARLGVAVDKLQRDLVGRSRAAGCSWTAIGGALGITKQAAWERFAGAE
jgi:hypothetical protein